MMTIIMVNNDDEVSNDMISMIQESRVEQLVVSRSARVSGVYCKVLLACHNNILHHSGSQCMHRLQVCSVL